MSLILLNALLILVGPFLVVAPMALAALAQFSPPRRRQPVAWRMPSIRLEVAW
jgi:hypothetical protein